MQTPAAVTARESWGIDMVCPASPGLYAKVASWVIMVDTSFSFAGDDRWRVVSEPQTVDRECFDLMEPMLTDFSYRAEEETIYFYFRDANAVRAGKRHLIVLIANVHENDVGYVGVVEAELINEDGTYRAEYDRLPAYLNYANAWRISENLGQGLSAERSSLQPLDREALATPSGP